jgi:hypothetical protein
MEWLGLFGGIGGALMGFYLNHFIARKAAKRIGKTTLIHRFELPDAFDGKAEEAHPLLVSWNGESYQALAQVTSELKNLGRKTVDSFSFVTFFPKETIIIKAVGTSSPMLHGITFSEEIKGAVKYLTCIIPSLEKGDSVTIYALYNGIDPVSAQARGLDDVEVILFPDGMPINSDAIMNQFNRLVFAGMSAIMALAVTASIIPQFQAHIV